MSEFNLLEHYFNWHEVAKPLPPIAVSGLTLLGYPISDMGIFLTCIYTSIMIWVTVRDRIINNQKE